MPVKLAPAMQKTGHKAVVDIVRLGINGEGVGYLRGQVVFVPGALPGEKVKVEATEVKQRYAQGRIIEILQYSKQRTKHKCHLYYQCGGCSLQHFDYQGQLQQKREMVVQAFAKYLSNEFEKEQGRGKEKTTKLDFDIKPTIGMKEPWQYRNKAQMPVREVQNRVVAGLYQTGSNRLIEMEHCLVHHPDVDKVIQGIRKLVGQLQVPVQGQKQRSGLKHLVVRISFATRELQVILVSDKLHLPNKDKLVNRIAMEFPKVVSIAQNINPGKSHLVLGEETLLLWGQERLLEQVGELKFGLSPRSFFQLNPQQMQVLYEQAAKAAGLTGTETVLDAYCGAGTIALWLAGKAKEVRGIEAVADAIVDANYNAGLNGIENAKFYAGEVERVLPRWVKEGYRPDVIVLDPPRTGCDDRVLKAVVAAKPQRIVYVSCNPATLAKDCKDLVARGYRVAYVQPVDMFPQTSQVESVVLIERK